MSNEELLKELDKLRRENEELRERCKWYLARINRLWDSLLSSAEKISRMKEIH